MVEIVSSCIFAEQIRQIWIHATHMLLHVSTFLLNILLPIYPTVLVLGIIFVFVEYPTNRSRATQYSCWLALYPGTLVAPLMLSSPKLPQNTCCLWPLICSSQSSDNPYLVFEDLTQSLLSILAAHLVDRHLGNFIWRYFGNQISTYNWLGFRKWERISLEISTAASSPGNEKPICQPFLFVKFIGDFFWIYLWFFWDFFVIFIGFLCDLFNLSEHLFGFLCKSFWIFLLCWNLRGLPSWKWKTHLPAFWLSMAVTWFGKGARLLIL